MQVYLVGGAVRDIIMGLEPNDRDYVVVGSTPEEMLSLGFTQVGADFPVFLHPETGEEYALARRERKTGDKYQDFSCDVENVTLEEDLSRRDFTMNAMAMTSDGEIIDPFNGQKDIKDEIIRHTSKAFSEDPLRILRAIRFAARYDFLVAEETIVLIDQMLNDGMLSHVHPNRVVAEFTKACRDPNPQKFFNSLWDWEIFSKADLGCDTDYHVSTPVIMYCPEYTMGQFLQFDAGDKTPFTKKTVEFSNMIRDSSALNTPQDYYDFVRKYRLYRENENCTAFLSWLDIMTNGVENVVLYNVICAYNQVKFVPNAENMLMAIGNHVNDRLNAIEKIVGYKMYICVLDEVPQHITPTLVAHTVLNAHMRFCGVPDYDTWLRHSFKKCVVSVNRKEFDKISKFQDVCIGHENKTLNGEPSCIVVMPMRNYKLPNVLKFAKLWK